MNTFVEQYLSLLANQFKGLNLTRITNELEFEEKQYKDSLHPFFHLDYLKANIHKYDCVLDIGFGGGFPLLPLANSFPDQKFFGFEARNKKVQAVNQIAEMMNIHNVKCFHKRIESVLIDKKVLCLFKAVGTMRSCLDKIQTQEEIQVGFYKGPLVEEKEEIHHIPHWNLFQSLDYSLANDLGERKFFLFKNVPRGTFPKSSHHLVKLSEII